MRTSYLLGLLTLGFIMLFLGWPWWLGVGVIILSMAAAVGGGEDEQPMGVMQNAVAQVAKTGAATVPKKENWPGWDIDDMKWSPTTFADGMMGVNPMETGNEGSAIGARSGTVTQDMGPIRFKDDFRFRLNETAEAEFYKMCADPYTGKGLTAWDFRTRKDVFPGLHSGTVKTVESPDDVANPGLGSPNEWLAKMKSKKQ